MKNEKLAIPFITLSKSVNWLKSLGRRNDENLTLLERVSYVTTLTYTSVRNIYKVRKDIVKGLVDETSLSKKQAKKLQMIRFCLLRTHSILTRIELKRMIFLKQTY